MGICGACCNRRYSQLVTYLHCSKNNYTETVLSQFIEADKQYDFLSRTRSDFGCETVDLPHFMILLRGQSRGSHITGQSINNQRIERRWCDVFTECLSLFYHDFYYMENRGILDSENTVQLYSLHYVYVSTSFPF